MAVEKVRGVIAGSIEKKMQKHPRRGAKAVLINLIQSNQKFNPRPPSDAVRKQKKKYFRGSF